MRADKFFAEKFGSRTKAQSALQRGLVLRGGVPVSPKDEVTGAESFEFLAEKPRFVSEGGYKLERGLDAFGENVRGQIFADLGASTGGFTDCLLQRGADRVYCVDVGKSLLDASLLPSGKVVVMDETNARYLTADDFPEKLDGVVSDLSFISLRLVLPAIEAILPEKGRAIVLFKPQFECGGKGLGKSGICPTRLHGELLAPFYDFALALGLSPQDIVNAPLRPKKNIEYILRLEKNGDALAKDAFLARASKIY